MEQNKICVEHTYTREQILLLRAEYRSLPEHLLCLDYLTSHGKFSPDKYVECLWKNERVQKSVSRVIRSEIPEVDAKKVWDQVRVFSLNNNHSETAFSQLSTRNSKVDKRGTASAWSNTNKNFSNGCRSAIENARNNGNGMGRRDAERVEPLPEWMDDGPDDNSAVMQLGGFNDQEKRLEQSFQKLGLSEAGSRQKMTDEKKPVVYPTPNLSDAEFAAQFGILDVDKIESKIIKEQIEEPKSSRLSRFFGSDKQQEDQLTPKIQQPTETVLPAIARLLSAGSKSIGPINKATNSITMAKLTQPSTLSPIHKTSNPPDLPTNVMEQQSSSPQQPIYHLTMQWFSELNDSITQKQKKNIDLVPTAVMVQRSTVKDGGATDVRAPKFNNSKPSSPVVFNEQEVLRLQNSTHGVAQWSNENAQTSHDLVMDNPNAYSLVNYIPAFCRLGTHIFPFPNPLALAADNKHMYDAHKSGDYKTMVSIQTRVDVQMKVLAALQQFRHDASFLVVTANDPQFEQLLESFIEQQRQLDSSITEKLDDNLINNETLPGACQENTNQLHSARFTPSDSASLERLISSQNVGVESSNPNGFSGLSIFNKLPSSLRRPLTVEELERQIMGNC